MSVLRGVVVTASPVRCAVLALLRVDPWVPAGALGRWVGSPAYGHVEVLLEDAPASSASARSSP